MYRKIIELEKVEGNNQWGINNIIRQQARMQYSSANY
jgi:hypothetical protein